MLLFLNQIKLIKKIQFANIQWGGLLGKSEINLGLIMRFLAAHNVKSN
jgi:hypothetical protein